MPEPAKSKLSVLAPGTVGDIDDVGLPEPGGESDDPAMEAAVDGLVEALDKRDRGSIRAAVTDLVDLLRASV